MADLKFLGLATIGILLSAIIVAFIFSKKFREDVIASPGEASVFGMINVKGVIVVLLSAIFVGAFVYIIQMDNNKMKALDTPTAINHLKTSADNYSINYNPSSSCLELIVNGTSIGELTHDLKLNLNARKGKGIEDWNIGVGEMTLGLINLKAEQGYRSWHPGQNPLVYEQHQPYQIQNMNFFFRIDSIYSRKIDTLPIPFFHVRFGERADGEITWHQDRFTFNKTDNGKIDLNNGLTFLSDPMWRNDYYVGFGAGFPGGSQVAHVEMVNVFAVKIGLR